MRKSRKYSAEFKIQCIKEVVEEYSVCFCFGSPNLGFYFTKFSYRL